MPLETDYLVIGSGAMGLAFADEILAGDPAAEVMIVDRYGTPGGHWTRAYPFVSLHQPAAFYGVNSAVLGSGGSALATGQEVVAYFQQVMARMLATGRVKYFPQCEFVSGMNEPHRFSSLLSGETTAVTVRRKLVDATYMRVEVPSMREPPFPVASEARVIPVNGLVNINHPVTDYVVVGAGKTGIDAILYLLEHSVPEGMIRWIVPNDAWLLNRDTIFPQGILDLVETQQRQFAQSERLEQLLVNLESEGLLFRIDPDRWATKYRCATVNRDELECLRRIKNVVRLGRVQAVGTDQVTLEQGSIALSEGTLIVDCTANGLAKRPITPIFKEGLISLQSVQMCQQVFSASLIAHVETAFDDDDFRNSLCQVVPHPETIDDFLYCSRVNMQNTVFWLKHMGKWLRSARLAFMSHVPAWKVFLRSSRLAKLARAAGPNLNRIAAARDQNPEVRDTEGSVGG
ncbi:MAG TPA: hypothetical protein DCP57_12010 [Gammaproteobacteria bacterium]|nr:MAG: NAD(P)/FAD-dependent oxidoreductase [Gammaproteobacteria bacterium TMED134]RZO71974.1 MAG: NAD(P)/FAD-dependent oxidoreductase [OM182 bacterium]HAL43164.1 hypothetical protein [Gammaproteobacteria bacterium]